MVDLPRAQDALTRKAAPMTRRGWTLLLALGVIWGLPYLFIRIAVQDLDPVMVALGRTAVGALILLPFALRAQALMPAFRRWRWLTVYTLVEITGPWLFIGYAETRVNSSMAGLVIAITPLVAALVVARVDREPLSARRLCGLGLGLCGVASLVGLDLGAGDGLAVVALALSAVGYAIGPIVVAKKLSDLHPMGVVTGSLVLATAIYLPAIPFTSSSTITWAAAGSVVGLAFLCTAVAFVLLFALIAEAGPARATLIAYLNPAVAIGLGVLVLNEPLTIGLALGFPLIVTGCLLAASGDARAKAPARAAATARVAG